MAGGWGRLDARYTCGRTANELEVVGWAAGSICLGRNTGHRVCEHEPDLDLNVVGNAVLVHGLASDRSCGWAASVKQRGARACAVWVHWGRLGRAEQGPGGEGGGRSRQGFGGIVLGNLVENPRGMGSGGSHCMGEERGEGLEEVEEVWIGTLRGFASCCWCSGGHGRSAKEVEEALLLVFGLGEITSRGERGGEKRCRLYVFHSVVCSSLVKEMA